jgi:cell volume regulation protein A
VFVAWAGLRGAVPIVLATFALSANVEESGTIFNAVFFVVIVSALAQGMTLEPLARRLGLAGSASPIHHSPLEPETIRELGGELVELDVGDEGLAGTHIRDLGLPSDALAILIVRDGAGIPPRGDTRLARGDRVYFLVTGEEPERVASSLRAGTAPPSP